jgi:hypothetical protein
MADHLPRRVSSEYEFLGIGPVEMQATQAAILVREWGRMDVPPGRLADFLVDSATDDQVIDIIESWFAAVDQVAASYEANARVVYSSGRSSAVLMRDVLGEQYRQKINEILDDHDLAWQLVGVEMTPRSSMAMHATIVEPVMALTAGNPKYAKVEIAYREALKELKPRGSPSNAITDAGTALQEMLEAVGAKGNALGPLLIDARKRGLLAPYDSKLADAITDLGEWVSADRAARGDTHKVRDASREDAWLAVRVAGALILRLAAGRQR